MTAWTLHPEMMKSFLCVLYLYDGKLAQIVSSHPSMRVSLHLLVESRQVFFTYFEIVLLKLSVLLKVCNIVTLLTNFYVMLVEQEQSVKIVIKSCCM